MATDETFDAGDFVAVPNGEPDNYRIGQVSMGRKKIPHIKIGRQVFFRYEVEVWFGEVGEAGLPITYFIPTERLINIKGARQHRPFLTIKTEEEEVSNAASKRGEALPMLSQQG